MYSDETLPIEMKSKAASVKESEEMMAEDKVEALVGSLNEAVRSFGWVCVEVWT